MVSTATPRGLAAGPVAGALWMGAAAVMLTGMIVCIRLLSSSFSVFEISFFRSAVALVVMLPVLARLGFGYMRTRRLPFYMLRVLLAYGGMCSYYMAIAKIDIVDATTLNATVPLWAVVFAWLLLGEKVGPRRIGFTALGFAGAVVLLRPGEGAISEWALLGLASAAIYALTALCIKSLSRTEPASRMVIYLNVLMLVVSTPLAVWTWVTPGWADAPWIAGLGISAAIGHYCFTRACAAADASVVIPVDFVRLPLAALAGYLVFFTVPDIWTAVGAAIIFAAVVMLTRTEARQTVAEAAAAPVDTAADDASTSR